MGRDFDVQKLGRVGKPETHIFFLAKWKYLFFTRLLIYLLFFCLFLSLFLCYLFYCFMSWCVCIFYHIWGIWNIIINHRIRWIFPEFRKDPNLKAYIVIQQSVIFLFSLDIFQQILKTPVVRQGARWAPLKIEKVESNKEKRKPNHCQRLLSYRTLPFFADNLSFLTCCSRESPKSSSLAQS